LRVCSLEIFPVYFRLTLSTGELANTQIKAIFGLAEDGNRLKDYLIGLTTLLIPNRKKNATHLVRAIDQSPLQKHHL
jgi:hypothetical protein